MQKGKSVLQKLSMVSSVISYILAVVTAILLYIRLDTVGSDNPISASLMASTFFFLCIGVVFMILGRADIPSLKVGSSHVE